MEPVRIAIVGAGQIGQRHLGVILANSSYVAAGIADPVPVVETLARDRGIPYFTDIEAMLEEVRPDGVVVASPNQFHVAGALACIERRVPILVEKPLADSIFGALDIVEAAERAGVPVLVGHHRRHNPLMRKATAIIHEGGIGTVLAVAGTWLSHKPDDYFNIAWRREPGAGPVLINAIHDIDGLRMLCGEIETVQATTAGSARDFPVEDTAAAVIRFASGALGSLIVSDAVSAPWSWEWTSNENPYFYPHESENCYLITGSRGSLAVPSLVHWWHEPGQGWGDPLTRRRASFVPADPYVEQMRNFAGVIRGKEKPVVSGLDGARTLAATLAIPLSAQAGRPLGIDDLMRRDKQPAPAGDTAR